MASETSEERTAGVNYFISLEGCIASRCTASGIDAPAWIGSGDDKSHIAPVPAWRSNTFWKTALPGSLRTSGCVACFGLERFESPTSE